MKRHFVIVLIVLLSPFGGFQTDPIFAAQDIDKSENSFLKDSIDFRLASLNSYQLQQPAKSDFNHNNHLQINHQGFTSSLRSDFRATFPKLVLCFNPRVELQRNDWNSGPQKGQSATDIDFFVQEYAVRLPISESVLLSYGREDLQWGPALLLSPSNPFFSNNGQNQPKKEVAGAEYTKLIWSPNMQWSGSLFINMNQGRKKLLTDFNKTYAAKLDHLIEEGYFSLIASYQEQTQSIRLGGFVSWNSSDSTIVYCEGSFSDEELELLTGASFTFLSGGTITAEYFYNGNGRSHGSLASKLVMLSNAEARENLFSQNYFLLQYYDHDPFSNWTLLLRDTVNLDDNSFSLLIHGEYNVGRYTHIFSTVTINQGDRQSELASVIDTSVMIGFEVNY